MNRTPPALLAACLIALVTAPASPHLQAQQKTPTTHTFATEADHFTLDGKPFKVLSGELHYARIPREYWHARLKMAKAMGLNTIATYVFWNVHEPTPNHFDFTGQYDLAAFIKAAQQEGLYVILRAGPYSCAEWEFGGFPAWLLSGRTATDDRVPHPSQSTGSPASGLGSLGWQSDGWEEQGSHSPGFPLRSNDPTFIVPTERWIKRLAQEVAPLQIGHGGPIIMTQVENEYGNFGPGGEQAHTYMAHLKQIFEQSGFTASLLYSADNWRNIPSGSLEGLFAATNFGIGNHQGGMDALEKVRPNAPLFVSEYWPGWFDSWGHPHETRPIPPQLEDLDYILHRGAGINIYMFHGGTSFGFMSGAGNNKNGYLPDVTSYDYDAPLDEAGHPTPKFFAYRKLLAQYATCQSQSLSGIGLGIGKDLSSRPKAAHFAAAVEGPAVALASRYPKASALGLSTQQNSGAGSPMLQLWVSPGVCPPSGCRQTQSSDESHPEPTEWTNDSCLPPIPASPPVITIPTITLTESTPLWDNLPTSIPSDQPQPMERFGQSYGYILYRTNLPAAVTGDLVLEDLHDYAQIYIDGKLIGTLDRRHKQNTLPLTTTAPARLDIVVANDGRINSTKLMRLESKGITHAVTLASHPLSGWQIYPLPMTALPTHFTQPAKSVILSEADRALASSGVEGPAVAVAASAPTFRRAHFTLTQTGDAFLDIHSLGKGALWINGHPIGRFWNIGPQQTLYVPAPWLHKGPNEIVVFDLLPPPTAHVAGLLQPILNGPVPDQTTSSQQ